MPIDVPSNEDGRQNFISKSEVFSERNERRQKKNLLSKQRIERYRKYLDSNSGSEFYTGFDGDYSEYTSSIPSPPNPAPPNPENFNFSDFGLFGLFFLLSWFFFTIVWKR